jgi:hypothetical protein
MEYGYARRVPCIPARPCIALDSLALLHCKKRDETVQKKRRPAARRRSIRTDDPERTIADIIEVATREFAERGLAGARIDPIAQAMRTSRRMLYY